MCDAAAASAALGELVAHADAALAAAWEAVDVADAAASDAVASGWRAAESYLHAASAAAKPLGDSDCASLPSFFARTLPRAAALGERMASARGDPRGRALLCTALVTAGAFSAWLGAAPARAGGVSALLPTLLLSLRTAELLPPSGGEPDPWPMRSKQEHAGCVAFMKLCAACPQGVLAAAPLGSLMAEVHAAAAA